MRAIIEVLGAQPYRRRPRGPLLPGLLVLTGTLDGCTCSGYASSPAEEDAGSLCERVICPAGSACVDGVCRTTDTCEGVRCVPPAVCSGGLCSAADVDRDGDGALAEDDCDDGDPYRSPGLAESCSDGVDNDCDLDVDEGCCDPLHLEFRFDRDLEGWSFWGRAGYSATNADGYALVSGDSFSAPYGEAGGISHSFEIHPGSLEVVLRFRATSGWAGGVGSAVTNASLILRDATGATVLAEHALAGGGTTDTGWVDSVVDLGPYLPDGGPVMLVLALNDAWAKNWGETNSYDDIVVNSICP